MSFFGKNKWIQNPPNSPDLAYPIEELWSIIKPRVKRRDPKTIDELKAFILEEWNSVPSSLIRKLCYGYLDRVKMVLEFKGSRLEQEHLIKKIKKKKYINGKNQNLYLLLDLFIMIRILLKKELKK